MKILRAEHWGMCFGVRDAIGLALRQKALGPVTILGELVHNETVLEQLRERDIPIATRASAVTTPSVLISAHGASDRTRQELRRQGLVVVEATCPLVQVAHDALARLRSEGYYPVIVGKKGHVEVRGLAEDCPEVSVIASEDDVTTLPRRERYGVIAQTTQPLERVRRLFESVRRHVAPAEVRWIDTVCQPTKQRQKAAADLAQACDVVIVIGGSQSNNTQELAATCLQHCARVYHVRSEAELKSIWFQPGDTIGITAGTSTPDSTVDRVEEWLREFAAFQEQVHTRVESSSTPLN